MNWADVFTVAAAAFCVASGVAVQVARRQVRTAQRNAQWAREEADQWHHAYGQVSEELMRIRIQQSTVSPADTGDTAGNDHNPDRS